LLGSAEKTPAIPTGVFLFRPLIFPKIADIFRTYGTGKMEAK
jgi:hypothetical protein